MPTIANAQISIFHHKLQRGNLSSFLVETPKICPALGTGFVSFPGTGYPKDATLAFEAAETISKWEYRWKDIERNSCCCHYPGKLCLCGKYLLRPEGGKRVPCPALRVRAAAPARGPMLVLPLLFGHLWDRNQGLGKLPWAWVMKGPCPK